MKRVLILSFLAAVGVGCGGGGDDPVSGVKGYKDKFCKCPDEACFDKVSNEYDEWKSGMKKKGTKPSDDQMKAIHALEEEMEACAEAKGVK